jgi:hypothetical protein
MDIEYCYKNIDELDNDEYMCPITGETAKNPVITICNHIFEKNALNMWLEKSNSCPLCRTTIKKRKEIKKNYEWINKLGKSLIKSVEIRIGNIILDKID